MHLKRLEIHGFKSFADRTELEFRPGITAVVGPNGSGKSNVSDALLWVLGEGNARNLRGESAADLVFAGTDKRRPLGMAEVSLCIDNSDRALPVEFGEVTVTRRVYRSGEGEFFINRTACRLKDIYELFLDTGVGRDAYSIIGQNQIDAVLSARSEERRELLEEAAGIKKYRHRRKEACRKLDNTRQNLTRVYDILSELEDRVEPLEIEARAAERWKELNASLRELEIGLLAVDLLRKTEDLERVRDEKTALDAEVEGFTARLSREEAAHQQARLETARLEGAIESLRRSRDLAREEALKLEGRLALARQQAVADASERLRLVGEQTRLEARAEELEKEARAFSEEKAALESQLAGWIAQASERSPLIESLDRKVRDAQVALERLRREIGTHAARRAGLAEKARQMETRLAESGDRITQESARLQTLREEEESARLRHLEAESELASSHDRLGQLQESLKTLEGERATAQAAHEAAQSGLRERQTAAMRLSARLRSLEEMHRSLEGVYRGVKAVIQAARSGQLTGEFRVVADLVTVPPSYGMALEVALGAHAQDIVTQSDRDAQAAIAFLKRKSAGRATFLPLDLIRGDRMGVETGPGIHGVAVDLIEYPAEVRRVMESLLGRVLVVEDMETAIRLVRGGSASGGRGSSGRMSGGRMVTLDGELIHPNGSLTGGSREGGPGILSRKLEIDRLKGEVVEEEQRLRQEEEQVALAAGALSDLDRQREQLRGEIAAARVDAAQKESRLDHAGRELRRLERERADGETRLKNVHLQREEAQTQQGDLAQALDAASGEAVRLEEAETTAQAAFQTASEDAQAARAASSEVQVEIARAREQKRGLDERERRIERERREIRQAEQTVAESLSMLDERRQGVAEDETALDKDLDSRRAAAATLESRLMEQSNARTLSMETLALREAELKTLAGDRAAALEKSHRLEVREAGLVSDLEHLQLRLMVDYEAEPDHAPMLARAVASRQNTAVEVNRYKREMSALGTVNLGAIEEYRRVHERVTFLREQKTDLEEAEGTLLRVISEIDATTQEAFGATFERVRVAFEEMFRRLFNGGRSQLVLTDPDNILETGIDIIVQPPGKKLQHLQLLSGGEKALTAVALLFALLEVKPSPFCLLDEVDAALDEANVGRFADIVQDFAKRSQFIIITHNKATMAAADTLCGVTMQEPGVSKILSVKLED